jgi:hypothetical protein
MEILEKFDSEQIKVVTQSIELAEELVSNYYKMSANQWLKAIYDVKTLIDLSPEETIHGPFAQIIRYVGQVKDTSLGSTTYDYYKICLQDHSILSALNESSELQLFPFILYIVTHELVHIVRFKKFLQRFDASTEEKFAEESRVHQITHDILSNARISGMSDVFHYYGRWRDLLEEFGG